MGWAQPIFFWRDEFLDMTTNLAELLERTLPALGYELVDWEGAPRGRLVRVFIDKPEGSGTQVSVDDCAHVSNHLTRLFAVENVEFERLEVSSPGLDRPLKKAADFVRFAGEEAELRLATPIANAKKLKGVLRGCEGGAVVVETAKGAVTVPLADIDRARLVPKIEWRKPR
jgi:ribosome maturation factor RimP